MSPDRSGTVDDADADEPPADGEPHEWDDERLVETYRRLSRDLRRRGFEAGTVHRMGRVERALRDRGLDPDAIARELHGNDS